MNILIIAPDTFGYANSICGALLRQGHVVNVKDQIPSKSNIIRFLYRKIGFTRHLLSPWMRRFIIGGNKCDLVFIIKGEGLTAGMVAELKMRWQCKIVYYTWDSQKIDPGYARFGAQCDEAYSFDRLDCNSEVGLRYLPLFYRINEAPLTESKYVASFIGTLHSNRYREISAIFSNIKSCSVRPTFCYWYRPSKLLYAFERLVNSKYWRIPQGAVSFSPMSADLVGSVFSQSDIIVDWAHPGQSGLTMRTIEALGVGKKLITNNENILFEDFYSPKQILVWNDDAVARLQEFISQSHAVADMSSYQIDNWVSRIINE